MDRRSFVAASLLGLAGCATGTDTPTSPGTPTSAATPTDAATPTQVQGLGTIEYTVTNEDVESYRLEVAMENAEGRVVQETTEPEFVPGESVSSGSAGPNYTNDDKEPMSPPDRNGLAYSHSSPPQT